MTGVIDKLWERCAAGRAPSGPSTDVLRQVIKVAALSVALTARPGAAYRIGPPAIGRRTGC
jgi:hypothetical protein